MQNEPLLAKSMPQSQLHAVAWLPGSPASPCPELLTEDEAIRYLRLDTVAIKDPSATLRSYRKRRLLHGTQVSKKVFSPLGAGRVFDAAD